MFLLWWKALSGSYLALTSAKTYPGLDEHLYITAEAEAFVKWHAGQLSWAEATRDRRIHLHGPSWLVRAFPTWNARSTFAHIKPVSRNAASSVA